MTNETEVLHQSGLFDGVNDDDIEALLSCLGAERKRYSKGEVIFAQGTAISDFAILLSGKVHLQSIDYWGRVDLLGVIGAGECFGEAYEAGFVTLNSAVAADDCLVLFLDAGKLMTACPSACPFHSRAMRNMMSILASRNRILVEKAGILPAGQHGRRYYHIYRRKLPDRDLHPSGSHWIVRLLQTTLL